MIRNASLYLPLPTIPFEQIGDVKEIDGSLVTPTTYVVYSIHGRDVRLNVMPDAQVSDHLAGFSRYIDGRSEPGELKELCKSLVLRTTLVLGVIVSVPFGFASPQFSFLEHIIAGAQGFLFVGDSIMLPGMQFVFGPLSEDDESTD